MSRKRKKISTKFKAKVVWDLLETGDTVSSIASKYETLPKNVTTWKSQAHDNLELAFDNSSIKQKYEDEIKQLKKEKDMIAKKLGETIVEKEFLQGKLKSLVSFNIRKDMIEIKHKISLNKQLKLLAISKTGYYYNYVEKFSSNEDIKLLNTIDKICTKYPYYGTRRIKALLKRLGFNVGRKLIKAAMEVMNIKALYPKTKTTIANKEHKKYPYLLGEFKNDNNQVIIDTPNKVWSTDITYIKLEKGFAYLAAIIDWNTKKILSWKLSSTMDVSLTTDLLTEALQMHPKPDILNTDQGSQYTAKKHIDILVKNDISISMDAKGRSIDNIVIERFWRTLKYEDVYPSSYKTIKEARQGIKEYINIYNTERLHSSIGYLTPDEAYYKYVNNRCYDAKKALLQSA